MAEAAVAAAGAAEVAEAAVEVGGAVAAGEADEGAAGEADEEVVGGEEVIEEGEAGTALISR